MEDPDEPDRLSGLDAERNDVLDLEIDRLPDPDAVAQPFLDRPPFCPAKTALVLSTCSSVARSSMNTPTRQLPSVMTFGVSAITATASPLTSAPSISPSVVLKTSVTRQ